MACLFNLVIFWRLQLAISKLQFATEKNLKCLEIIENKLKKNPDDVEALIEKAFLYITVFEDFDEAEIVLENAFNLEPNNVDVLFWFSTLHYHGTGDEASAKELLEKALLIAPEKAECHDLLSSILQYSDSQEDREKSLWHCKKAVELEPTWFIPHIKFINQLIERNEFDKARQSALDALLEKCTIDEYYEYFITGRTQYSKSIFDDLLKKIRECSNEK